MLNARLTIDRPVNEPVRPYRPGDPETASLKETLDRMAETTIEIPCIIGGKEVRTGDLADVVAPHDTDRVLGRYHQAGEKEIAAAVEAAGRAYETWSRTPWQQRLAVFRRMGELLAGPWRDRLNASTMLGQSKTCHQAEIDSACELIDFFRFNPYFAASRVYSEQPGSATGEWNVLDHRPLEGFVVAITPFNFTSIAGNLPTSPAMMGNVVLWKPARTSILSSYYLMRLFQEAGLPDGVINFLPARGRVFGPQILPHRDLAGIHFTGSTGTFQHIWSVVAENLSDYRTYPRLVGETGGKDYIFAHPSANPDALVTALLRGAFEYQGQKCSAASRAYIPRSLWDEMGDTFLTEVGRIKMGDVRNFENFMGAVIDGSAYEKTVGYIEHARDAEGVEIIAGGNYSDDTGWFIEPTVLLCQDPKYKSMEEEIFAPVLSLYVYEDDAIDETLELCEGTSPYALTGAIFARDRSFIVKASDTLRNTAGNFYINDKPTGAVVGRQPFGGARASGTNDKAGSYLNLIRWVSPRTIKENLNPPTDWTYPFMG